MIAVKNWRNGHGTNDDQDAHEENGGAERLGTFACAVEEWGEDGSKTAPLP
jgi:hypothetical protein